MRVTNVRVESIIKVLQQIETEFCDIEIDERTNTINIRAIIPPTLLDEGKKGTSHSPEDFEGWM